MYFFSVFFISEFIFLLCRDQLLKSSVLCFCFNQNKQARIACIRTRKMINKNLESVSLLKNNLHFLNAETKSLTMIIMSYLEMLFRFVQLMIAEFKMIACLYISHLTCFRTHLSLSHDNSFNLFDHVRNEWYFEINFDSFSVRNYDFEARSDLSDL